LKLAVVYVVAAFAEIAGCFAFWAWLRLGKSALLLVPGMLLLALFAVLLTLIPTATAGRSFAAYGGVYFAASLIWMAGIEKVMPDRWDLMGASLCLLGASVILVGPRA
jgi:small multidrug resistance family-3 protein